MDKLRLIIAREYMTTVARKSFIITTLLIPFVMILCIALPVLIGMANRSGSDVETIAVLDQTGRYGGALQLHDDDLYHFVVMSADSVGDPRTFYNASDGAFEAVVVIGNDVDSTAQVTVYGESTINVGLKNTITSALSDTLTGARLASHGVPGLREMFYDSQVNVEVKSVKWSDKGTESESSTEVAMILGMVLSLLTYMFVLMYGAMIMNSVIEEKTNRIVEVIVSSCKPFQLMMGKIIGVALVGLTQLAIWTVLLGGAMLVLGGVAGITMSPADMVDPQAMAAVGEASDDLAFLAGVLQGVDFGMIFTCFVLYFIGGYLLYAALFASFGSAVDQASDASQFTTPIIMIMIIALYAGIACIENPNGPMAQWCSMIPFTSPVVMMIRLPYDISVWEIALSLFLLYATAALIVWIASRIYRTGILLYGKKTSFKDIMRWMKG